MTCIDVGVIQDGAEVVAIDCDVRIIKHHERRERKTKASRGLDNERTSFVCAHRRLVLSSRRRRYASHNVALKRECLRSQVSSVHAARVRSSRTGTNGFYFLSSTRSSQNRVWRVMAFNAVPVLDDEGDGARGGLKMTSTTASAVRPAPCLIVMCGKPASGKTTVVEKLKARLTRADVNADVVIVDEKSINAGKRNQAYENATHEKMTRGGLRSACDRVLHRNGPCVILDSLNAIKGFRYELWCVARAAAARYCVIHVEVSDDKAKAWNSARSGDEDTMDDVYSDAILQDLCFRFEQPVASNRWDSPLFTFRPATDSSAHEADILDAICAHVRGDASAIRHSARVLTPNKATQNAPLSETNLRHEMDRAAQEIVDGISAAVSANGGNPCSSYTFGAGMPVLRCSRVLTLAELRRRKRDFLQLASKSLSRPTREDVKKLFIECLQQQCNTV